MSFTVTPLIILRIQNVPPNSFTSESLLNFGIHNYKLARRAGSDGSMSASGPAGPGFDPGGVINFKLNIFTFGARRGGDVHFLIARLYITGLD